MGIKRRKWLVSFFLLLIIIVITVLFICLGLKHHSLDLMYTCSNRHGEIVEIKNDVLVKSSDGTEKSVNLPAKFSSDNTYYFNFVPYEMNPDKQLYMFIQGTYLEFSLQDGDEVLYRHQAIDTDILKSGGYFVRFIRIPKKYYGKELSLHFTSAVDSNYGIRIPDILLGANDDLLIHCYGKDAFLLIIVFILLTFSLESFVVVLSLYFHHKVKIHTLLMSLFSFAMAGYIIIRSPIVIMALSHGIFVYTLEYLFLLSLPVILGMFTINIFKIKKLDDRKTKLIKILTYVSIANIVIQSLLVLFGVSEFMIMQRITHFLFMVILVVVFILPFTYQNKMYRKGRMVLFLLTLINGLFLLVLVVYFRTAKLYFMELLGFGGLVFVTFQIIIVMRDYAKNHKKAYLSELHKKLALLDSLTGLANRNAFEQDLKVLNKKVYNKLSFMLIDINGLKRINDEYGHHIGDVVILKVVEIIISVVRKYGKLKAYRIGGDEFALVAYDVDSYYIEEVEKFINNRVKRAKIKKEGVAFDLAIGYQTIEINTDFDIAKLIAEVDEKMYADKKTKKEQ